MTTRSSWASNHESDTPYMRARQEWDTRMGSALVSAKNWRLACFASLGLIAMCIGGMIYLGSKPKAVPHIIQVDSIGAPSYVGPVGQTAFAPTDASLKYHLRRFIEDTRSISSDTALLKKNWLDAYQLVTAKGANMLTAWVSKPENEPFKRAAESRVTVDIVSMVRATSDTWQIDWHETLWDRAGNPYLPSTWRGMFRVVVEPPKTEEAMRRNPIGLFVDEFHLDKVQEP